MIRVCGSSSGEGCAGSVLRGRRKDPGPKLAKRLLIIIAMVKEQTRKPRLSLVFCSELITSTESIIPAQCQLIAAQLDAQLIPEFNFLRSRAGLPLSLSLSLSLSRSPQSSCNFVGYKH